METNTYEAIVSKHKDIILADAMKNYTQEEIAIIRECILVIREATDRDIAFCGVMDRLNNADLSFDEFEKMVLIAFA